MAKETVLITGASSGIGMGLAKLFAADGSDLVLVARREDRLNELAEELKSEHGIEVHVLPKDLSKKTSPKEIFNHLKKEKIEIDVLVNNAGFGSRGTVSELDTDLQVDMVQVNAAALTHLTSLFLPGIIERGQGGILNVGSLAGFQPGPNLAVYFATKAYVLSFTEALAEEISNPNIKVSCFAPGPVKTEFGEKSDLEDSLLFKLSLMDLEPAVKAGYEGFRKGKTIVIPGLKQQIVPFLNRFTPRLIVRKIAKKLNS
ncbi:MAG: SDR family oxidoreductase [Candidatus Dadabacteria bacterium]|nr:SDR family oxidoreductase [Candidatus Dadabacteria bacterium]MCZ6528421.1 SDR family oxidoreductase [Candidatus Dadabacteria bacterium]MCZ6555085.1 SDR family oxidoreductase [Candidatus Dadabacteria bacterium]MCZ6791295.1 SDR family oxidoreductase [Candidatus Dadabacteria bacterium]MCZ6864686.1 SDR family oxidoreductase [Candidatus Dadabacteria bacterium]